jgi:hypothetical protein
LYYFTSYEFPGTRTEEHENLIKGH